MWTNEGFLIDPHPSSLLDDGFMNCSGFIKNGERPGWFTDPGSDDDGCQTAPPGAQSQIAFQGSSVFLSSSLPTFVKDAWRGLNRF
jgi:hypothetical protein